MKWLCPLCNQTVPKGLYDKITGIWAEKQKIEGKYKEKIVALKKEKTKLKDAYLQKKKNLQDKFKSLALLEIKRKTKSLNYKIDKLNKDKNEINKKAERRIHLAIHSIESREKTKYEKQTLQIKRDLNRSARKELDSKIKERELKSKQREIKLSQFSESKIGKYRKEIELANVRAQSLTKTTFEQQKKIIDLQNQLKKQTTPQVEGLLYEDQLLDALKSEFPEDRFQHTGKGGDIIQSVIYKNNPIGTIVYECKRVLKFSKSHIAQAAEAKRQRKADFAILVTNATKKGYNGFTIEKDVIIIHPTGVVSLAKLLRARVIQIANLNISKAQRNKVVQDIMEYMESAQFKNSLEHIIQTVKAGVEDLQKEIEEHRKRWHKKREAYANIYKEIISVKQKTSDMITGTKSKIEIPISIKLKRQKKTA